MQKFTTLTAIVAYIPLANIDTDMIIPKQYLKTIKKSGLGKYLFADQRYDMQGNTIEDFVLNHSPLSKILVTGANFGCGSSREPAPWALVDFGISVIIAPSFADIFYNNCFKNGLLPISLPPHDIDRLLNQASEMTVNLTSQFIKSGGEQVSFATDAHLKELLLQGLDDIDKIMQLKPEITLFEQQHFTRYPWIRGGNHA